MVRHPGHALLDCGDGRRLDAFGELVVDRPAPGATEPRRTPERWAGAAVYHRGSGWWAADSTPLAETGHPITIEGLTMEVRPTPSGQVGLFPEHAVNAAWLREAVRARLTTAAAVDGPEVLNLFAYTGLATLVTAREGGRVAHVDGSRPSVQWARRNAELSGLSEAPIRWIVDGALAFVEREARRGRRYAGIVVDPPSYGHGTRGRSAAAWRFDDRIDELLAACAGVAEPDAFWLLSAHSPGWDAERLAETLRRGTGARTTDIEAIPVKLLAESGTVLVLGAAARLDLRLDPRQRDRR